eukprot:6331370-Prymnesium_polylepis.2
MPTRPNRFSIKVSARVRPPLPREVGVSGEFVRCLAALPDAQNPRQRTVVVTADDRPVLLDAEGRESGDASHLRRFALSDVFDDTDTTDAVYERCCSDAVRSVGEGYNATCLCYGQTGSGKTFTMFGDGDHDGLVAMAARQLTAAPGRSVQMSFLQIYGRELSDLIAADALQASSPLKLRDVDGDVDVVGLTCHAVDSAADALRLLRHGLERRRVCGHALNESSSRSHAIVTFHVSEPAGEGRLRYAKLHLVDLAGSERVKDSGVTGTVRRPPRTSGRWPCGPAG